MYTYKRMKLDSYLLSCTQVNSKWIECIQLKLEIQTLLNKITSGCTQMKETYD